MCCKKLLELAHSIFFLYVLAFIDVNILLALYHVVLLLHISCHSLCCAYLSFKVEEYNVNVDQFVHVLKSDLRARIAELILSSEVQ